METAGVYDLGQLYWLPWISSKQKNLSHLGFLAKSPVSDFDPELTGSVPAPIHAETTNMYTYLESVEHEEYESKLDFDITEQKIKVIGQKPNLPKKRQNSECRSTESKCRSNFGPVGPDSRIIGLPTCQISALYRWYGALTNQLSAENRQLRRFGAPYSAPKQKT